MFFSNIVDEFRVYFFKGKTRCIFDGGDRRGAREYKLFRAAVDDFDGSFAELIGSDEGWSTRDVRKIVRDDVDEERCVDGGASVISCKKLYRYEFR